MTAGFEYDFFDTQPKLWRKDANDATCNIPAESLNGRVSWNNSVLVFTFLLYIVPC